MTEEPKFTKRSVDFFEEDMSRFPATLFGVLEDSVNKYGDLPSLGEVFKTPITYKEFYARVVSISDLLMERGVAKGDRIAILGENSPNWGISYFAIVRTGAVAVPILPEFPESDIRHILNDSEAKILFTTQRQLEKITDLDRTKLSYIIMLDDFDEEIHSEIKLESLTAIFDRAIDFLKKIPESMGLKSRNISGDDLASIIYTSGTSGHSKAVMLTHKNFIANAVAMTTLIEIFPDDIFLSFLPMSHSYEFTVGFLLPLFSGCRILYLSKPPTPRVLEEACKVEKPTAICAVPLILEKIYKKKVATVLEKKTAVRLLTKIPGIKRRIYQKINKKLIDFFGGRLRVMAVGGAALNIDAERFFRAAGFPYLIGYGLTETAPLLSGGPHGDKTITVASAGKVCPGCEVKIVDPNPDTGIGEIVGRGPNVMKGYYKNPELSHEVLDEGGWFKTGDLGFFDKYENLCIRGRSKNMILTSNGENVFPEAIEEKVNSCFHVLESLVVESNGQLEAWVYLDYDMVDSETRGKLEPQRLDYIKEILHQIKEQVNEQLASYSKLNRVIEQNEPFVKTPTHKIKRYLYTHKQDA